MPIKYDISTLQWYQTYQLVVSKIETNQNERPEVYNDNISVYKSDSFTNQLEKMFVRIPGIFGWVGHIPDATLK